MKIKNTILILILLLTTICVNEVFAEKGKENETITPSCTTAGQIQCPKGLKPNCPKQYKPSCVFLGTKQRAACLADSYDNTVFNYNLDKISCKK